MSSPGTITNWVRLLKAGEREGVERLWAGYFPRLVAVARGKLRGVPRRAADEEDVALSAFDSFCRAAEAGRFPRLEDRDDLWQLLVMVTVRKAADLVEHEGRGKRDWRRLRGVGSEAAAFAELVRDTEPDPAFAAELADRCRQLLGKLGDDELRRIAVHKMEGCSNEEIAELIGRSPPTVERRLRLIRTLWRTELDERPGG